MKRSRLGLRYGVAACLVSGMLATATVSQAFRMIRNTTIGRVTAGAQVTCDAAGGFTHWNNPNIRWVHNTARQGAGMANPLRAAMGSWNSVLNARHRLTYGGVTTLGWATDNVNTLLWARGNGCVGNCLALTALVLQAGQVIVETDITFNDDVRWRTNGNQFDVQTVATHELGHSMGIHHTEVTGNPRPTMFATYFGSGGRSLEADDRAALECAQCEFPTLSIMLRGEGVRFAGRNIASLFWNFRCVDTANVDVFRNGVRIATTGNDGAHTDMFFSTITSANYWVCEAGSTPWYNSATCSNVVTAWFSF